MSSIHRHLCNAVTRSSNTVTGFRKTRILLTGFDSFCHNSHQAQQMQCALHAQQRLFKKWRHSVQSRVADWMHGSCRATIRRRLHLKGWQSEQQWRAHYETRRCLLLPLGPALADQLFVSFDSWWVCCFYTAPQADAYSKHHGKRDFLLVLLHLTGRCPVITQAIAQLAIVMLFYMQG